MAIPIPPQAPMAPGFDAGYGPPPGAVHMDDWPGPSRVDSPMPHQHHRGGSPHEIFEVFGEDAGPKTNKKKKDKKVTTSTPVETSFVGHILQKAEPLTGQKSTWARVGRRDLPFDDKKLEALVKEHRRRTRTGASAPADDFSQLNSNQQGVITRLIAEHKQAERNANADWVLVDVYKHYTRPFFGPPELKSIRLILKRQDKSATKPGERTSTSSASTYQAYEIIDLNEPLFYPRESNEAFPKESKEGKPKKMGKKHQTDDIMGILNDPIGLGIPTFNEGHGNGQGQRQNHHQQPHQHHQHPQQQPQHHQQQHHIPFDDPFGQPPYPPQPPPGAFQPQQQQQQMPPPFVGNPFTPNPQFMPGPEFMPPGPFESPRMGGHGDGDGGRFPRARAALRSPSPRRKRSKSAKRIRQLEDEVEDLKDKVENWHVSSGSSAEGDSVFSRPSGGSFTPPSTPPLSDAGPRGSLHRRKSFDRRPEYRRETRDRRYRDERAEVRPAQTHRPRPARYLTERSRQSPERIQYSPERSRYRQERPRYLERAVTYDDYPQGRAAEPRFVPRMQPQRRLTDYEEAYDVADFDDQYRRRREGQRRMSYDRVPEVLEPVRRGEYGGRREEGRYERRRNSVVGGGNYYV